METPMRSIDKIVDNCEGGVVENDYLPSRKVTLKTHLSKEGGLIKLESMTLIELHGCYKKFKNTGGSNKFILELKRRNNGSSYYISKSSRMCEFRTYEGPSIEEAGLTPPLVTNNLSKCKLLCKSLNKVNPVGWDIYTTAGDKIWSTSDAVNRRVIRDKAITYLDSLWKSPNYFYTSLTANRLPENEEYLIDLGYTHKSFKSNFVIGVWVDSTLTKNLSDYLHTFQNLRGQ
jgi:hypothetical protein